MRVSTFELISSVSGETLEGELERGPSVVGLCGVRLDDGKRICRHYSRLKGLDDEATKILAEASKLRK